MPRGRAAGARSRPAAASCGHARGHTRRGGGRRRDRDYCLRRGGPSPRANERRVCWEGRGRRPAGHLPPLLLRAAVAPAAAPRSPLIRRPRWRPLGHPGGLRSCTGSNCLIFRRGPRIGSKRPRLRRRRDLGSTQPGGTPGRHLQGIGGVLRRLVREARQEAHRLLRRLRRVIDGHRGRHRAAPIRPGDDGHRGRALPGARPSRARRPPAPTAAIAGATAPGLPLERHDASTHTGEGGHAVCREQKRGACSRTPPELKT